VGDVGAAAAYLRALPNSNQKVGVIGYCSGGRQSVLSACRLDLDAAVDCYGAFVVASRPESTMTSIVDLLPNLSCPLLGLFGLDDQYPSPEQTETLRELLTKHAKDFTFHEYEGAGHAFFNETDRLGTYDADAAQLSWGRTVGFLRDALT